MKILFKFASRSRPQKLLSCIDNINKMCQGSNHVILVTLDIDDKTVATKDFNNQALSRPNTICVYGFSKGKIDAINRDLWMVEEFDILINTSDDMWFTMYGFDDVIRDDFAKWFPYLDGFLHYPDGSQATTRLSTMSIMGRKYFDRFKYIYHPDYISVYCDQEATDVAKKLGKHLFIDTLLFEHRHPVWKKAEWDEQYRKTEDKTIYAQDRATFERRKAINFEL